MSRFYDSNPNPEEYETATLDNGQLPDDCRLEKGEEFEDVEVDEETTHCHSCGMECGSRLCEDCEEAAEETPEMDDD